MRQSEHIDKLVGALVKAQADIDPPIKDSTNPHFRSGYASLAAVRHASHDALTKNGLAIVQTTIGNDDGTTGNPRVAVETTLVHTSGQYIGGITVMTPAKNDPQGYGSALTYARRYGLLAILGLAPEDDDGNAASGKRSTPEDRAAASGATKSKPAQTKTKAKAAKKGGAKKTTAKTKPAEDDLRTKYITRIVAARGGANSEGVDMDALLQMDTAELKRHAMAEKIIALELKCGKDDETDRSTLLKMTEADLTKYGKELAAMVKGGGE